MNTFKRKVFINVSDIASYIGQNKWSITEPFDRLWKKADPNYNECLNVLKNNHVNKSILLLDIEKQKNILDEKLNDKLITKKDFDSQVKNVEKQIIECKQDQEKLIKKIESVTLTHIEKIEKELSSVCEGLGNKISETITDKMIDTKDKRKTVNESIDNLLKQGKIKEHHRVELLKNTESLINKTHGTLKEQSAIDIFEKKFNVKLDTSQKYYKYMIKSTETIEWYIGGKLDGINTDYIIEVKNRTKGFFNSLRDYELTQIQLYLLLTHYTKAKLVEKFNDKIRITDIDIDNNYINEILTYLNIFIESMETFIKNDSMKMKYLNLEINSDKQEILNKLYLITINEKRNEDEQKKLIKNQDQNYISDLDSDEL